MNDIAAEYHLHADAGPTVVIDRLDFAFAEKPLFSGLTINFPDTGGLVGLVGPNGAGKTTLLRLIMGVLAPDQGTVSVGGVPLAAYSRREIARLMTLVPQDTQIDYPFAVEELVLMGRHPHLGRFQPPGPHDMAVVQAAMRQTTIDHLAERRVNTLSGGERQRVLVARSIAQETPIVLLDEVTANLDLCHQLEIMHLARAMADDGRLVIATVHDLAMASRYCDRILLLAEGAIQADGPPEAVLSTANLQRHFSIEAVVEACRHLPRGLSITPLHPLPLGEPA